MQASNVNKIWANSVDFKEFIKDSAISKLSKKEQGKLYESVTGKSLKDGVNKPISKME